MCRGIAFSALLLAIACGGNKETESGEKEAKPAPAQAPAQEKQAEPGHPTGWCFEEVDAKSGESVYLKCYPGKAGCSEARGAYVEDMKEDGSELGKLSPCVEAETFCYTQKVEQDGKVLQDSSSCYRSLEDCNKDRTDSGASGSPGQTLGECRRASPKPA